MSDKTDEKLDKLIKQVSQLNGLPDKMDALQLDVTDLKTDIKIVKHVQSDQDIRLRPFRLALIP